MLDCANGYQKEKQEKGVDIEESCRQEIEARAEADNCEKIGEEENRPEESCGKEKKRETARNREGRECSRQGYAEETTSAERASIFSRYHRTTTRLGRSTRLV